MKRKIFASFLYLSSVNGQTFSQEPAIIWKRGSLTLTMNDFNSWQLTSPPPILAMIHYKKDSNAESIFKSHPGYILTKEDANKTYGFALIRVANSYQISRLAEIAHEREGCGQIEIIDPNFTLIEYDQKPASFLYHPRVYLESVKNLLVADEKNLESTISTLSSLVNRKHHTEEGKQAANLVRSLFEDAGSNADNFSVSLYSHTLTDQQSVIGAFSGSEDDRATIIIGAHLDSIAQGNIAPGADDDASGIAALVEAITILAKNGDCCRRRVEFHGYAAEEIGLIGSSEIAESYQKEQRHVIAMLQLDMMGYSAVPNDTTIYLIKDDTNTDLRRTLMDLLITYSGGNFAQGHLPSGATSDHRSWHIRGIPAVFPFENPELYNKKIHTPYDTIDQLNTFPLAQRITNLAIAFIAHIAGIRDTQEIYNEKRSEIFPESLSNDLKIALFSTDSPSSYQVAIATPKKILNVEACIIADAHSDVCLKERLTFNQADERDHRHIFTLPTNLTITDSLNFRVFGYDNQGSLAAIRHVSLSP